MTPSRLRFNVPPVQRALLLLCILLICYIITALLAYVIFKGGITAGRVAIATMCQDILLFVIPAVATAVVITPQAATFLSVDRNPGALATILALLALIISIPVMNEIIAWNAAIEFPHSLDRIVEWMRDMEESANTTVSVLIDGSSVANLIIALLVIGIFAGFSEELLFRGTIQRMLITANVSPHVAIWLTAIMFSAMHMQFFGFVPRLLLGAMFGYMAWWSGSVWISVTAHATNNMLAATTIWLQQRGASGDSPIDPTDIPPVGVAASIVMTIFTLWLLYRVTHKKSAATE